MPRISTLWCEILTIFLAGLVRMKEKEEAERYRLVGKSEHCEKKNIIK